MKIVVTGAAGRLGAVTCQELTASGHDVIATDVVAGRDPGVPLFLVDLLTEPSLRGPLAEAEAIVHLGNHPNHRGRHAATVYRENVTMNFHIARLAVDAKIRRLVFASSVQVCSGEPEVQGGATIKRPAYVPADGDLPAVPYNPYSLSKEAGEQVLRYLDRSHAISSVAIRYPMLLERRESLTHAYHRPNEFFSWLSYRDGARLIVAILAHDLPGFRIYFPASPRAINELSAEENLRRHYAGIPLRQPREKITALVDTSAITRETGWIAS